MEVRIPLHRMLGLKETLHYCHSPVSFCWHPYASPSARHKARTIELGCKDIISHFQDTPIHTDLKKNFLQALNLSNVYKTKSL